jgi:hypothetical protein
MSFFALFASLCVIFISFNFFCFFFPFCDTFILGFGQQMDERETDDPCCYLLAIWSPGEVPRSIPNLDDCNHEDNPFATSSFANEADSIKGTLLVSQDSFAEAK